MTGGAKGSTIGILPALGSGLTDLRRGGQHERLLGYDLRHYAAAYDTVYYFSYFDEALADFTLDPLLRERVVVLRKRGHRSAKAYAILMPFIYRDEFRRCEILRVMQFPGVIPALGAQGLFGTPFVVTYGYKYGEVARIAGSRMKPRFYSLLERAAIPRAAGVIVTSTELEAHVTKRYPAARVIYAPNGVDTTDFAPRPHRAQGNRRSVLYVGRLSTEKNVARLVTAIGRLPGRPRLVVIGSGERRADLEREAVAAGVDIEFRGVVPHSELPKHFNGADAFVLPSLTEGHPKVLIAAMACGLPCAVSARGGNLTLVQDGVTGLLFDPEDTGAMSRVIERLLSDGSMARRLGAAARALIAERYDAHALLEAEVRFVRQASQGAPLRELFEQYADAFPIDDTLPEFVARRFDELVRARPRAVLDVGAGDGRYLGYFQSRLAGALVVGCELSFTRAQRMRAKGLRVVVARSEELPFRDGAFDLVTLVEVIEHTQSPARSLEEVRRVLRRGGRLALTTPNYPVKRLYDARAAVRARDLRRLRDDPTHISPLSARRLERLLAPRFEAVELEGTSLLGESRSRWVRALKGSPFGRRLSNKLFAVCAKGE
jgi:glycosyltransferase involved in cell wall biosynthesis/2-polyprenyl-3-methyl-5-hydroxy-6-metoxy-1,4-benzoquinol methylase